MKSFYQEWFAHPEWWFKATPEDDKYISKTFGHLLDIQSWNPSNIQETIECILIYDQLPRHIFRGTASHHIYRYYLHRALAFSSSLSEKLSLLSNEQWCFVMMPWRHTEEATIIYSVVQQAWTRYERNKTPMLQRFIKATYERWPVQNQEHFMHKVIPTRYNPITLSSKYHHIVKVFRKNIDPDKKYILSLSGGVDSMVCGVLLAQHIPPIDYQVVHINYGNRKTTTKEEDFVKSWTMTVLGKRLYVRRIEEINRQLCMDNQMRDTYESYTRNVRYACYRFVDPNAIVILGHNRDDCLENIFQNISHQTKYENLRGMETLSIQDDISFLRPLLSINKKDIIQLAKDHDIPHLPNSTPSWSMRGQIRNKIVRVMDEWNPSFVPNLFTLSDAMQDLYQLANMYADDFMRDLTGWPSYPLHPISKTKVRLTFSDMTTPLLNPQHVPRSSMFWTIVLDKLYPDCHISVKSIRMFMERLTSWLTTLTPMKTTFQLSKDISIVGQVL